MVTIYNFTPHQVIKSIRITDCRGSRGKAAYTDVTHPLNPPPVRGRMFYDANYPDAVNLGFQETDRRIVLIFVLPTP